MSTVNCAHRGASSLAPENTMAAYLLAIEQGARMIELDVRLTEDGHVVVFHDPDLLRTTDGRGRVEASTLAYLRGLDAGSWFAPRFAGERIPVLEEVLDLASARDIRIDVELKFNEPFKYGLCHATGRLLASKSAFSRCVVTSFDHDALSCFREEFPQASVARLYDTHAPSVADLENGWSSAAVYHALTDAALVSRVHEAGGEIHVWTVDDPVEMRRLIELGVDTVMSNTPAVLQAVLDRHVAGVAGEGQANQK